jgi:16S rRNA (guanine527-N7)-methyltransferase
MGSEIISKYFSLSAIQIEQLNKLLPLYSEWNSKINVISRKDIDALYLHHVLHSLSILKFYDFTPGSEMLDLGTGGGFPGIPLAILCPDVEFYLIDGTQKKLKVVQSVADQLELKNISVKHIRAEYLKKKFDMVVTRAVAGSEKLLEWGRPLLKKRHINAFPNGIIALKGGDIQSELKQLPRHEYYELHPIKNEFAEPYFDEKYVVYIQG